MEAFRSLGLIPVAAFQHVGDDAAFDVDLLSRFREHTIKLFDRHGMKSVAYWTPLDEPEKSNTLIYILQHRSREAAAANWKSFQDDPDWKSVHEKSEVNGKLVNKVDSTFLVHYRPGRENLPCLFGREPLQGQDVERVTENCAYPRPFFLISIFSRRIFWFNVDRGTWKRSAVSV